MRLIQLFLPFSEWKVPLWAVRAFAIANASNASWKTALFYPFKDAFLQGRGRPDGWDLQTLTDYCWGCGGSGIWSSECGRWSDICNRCGGTGVHRQRDIVLRRMLLGDGIYHIPDSTCSPGQLLRSGSLPRETITKRIKHDPQGYCLSSFCALALFVVFDFPRVRRFIEHVAHYGRFEIPQVSWFYQNIYWPACAWYRRNKPRPGSCHEWPNRTDDDDIPF